MRPAYKKKKKLNVLDFLWKDFLAMSFYCYILYETKPRVSISVKATSTFFFEG